MANESRTNATNPNLKRLMLMLLALPAWPKQTPTSVSLAQAQQYAVEHSFMIRGAQLDAESAARRVKELTAIGLPQVSGSMEYQNFIDIPVKWLRPTRLTPPYLNQFLFDVSQKPASANAPVDPNAVTELQFAAQNMSAGIQVTQLVFDGSYFEPARQAERNALAERHHQRKTPVTRWPRPTYGAHCRAERRNPHRYANCWPTPQKLKPCRSRICRATGPGPTPAQRGRPRHPHCLRAAAGGRCQKAAQVPNGTRPGSTLTLTDKLDNLISEDMSMLSPNFKPRAR